MKKRLNKALAMRLQRLAQALAGAPEATRAARLTCAECESALEFYVDAERRGAARTRFPAVWRHLQTCARCRESYRLLSESLVSQDDISLRAETPAAGAAFSAAPPLPFLAPAARDAAWTKRVRSRVGGAPLGFGFIIQALHLQRAISARPPALALRGQPGLPTRALVLSDTVALGAREVAVQMWAQRLEDSAHLRLEVSLASSAPLPEPLRATLRWNDHAYSDLVRQGQLSFDGIPASTFEQVNDVHIEFECGDESTRYVAA